MNIENFSKDYKTRKLTKSDTDIIYDLLKKNIIYYKYAPPFVTKESIIEDLYVLPPNKTIEDKYYIGYFDEDKLIAVMDLIDHYKTYEEVYIGFFMTDVSVQKNGIGSKIIDNLSKYLKSNNYKSIELAYIFQNKQAEHFWKKNNFVDIKTVPYKNTKVNVAKRIL